MYILWVYVAATIAVIFGVGFENEVFSKSKQHVGWLLLLFALGLETYLTIELFAVDSEIIHRQQSTIEQLVTPRKLSSEQRTRLASAIGLRRSIPFVAVSVPDAEAWDFVMEISAALVENGLDWQPFPGGGLQALDGRPRVGTSILNHIQIDAPKNLEQLAKGLASAIRDPRRIGMDDVRVVISDSPITMTILVGTKR
jgi:hypothetical protein